MKEPISEETLDRIIDACAWLIGIAQDSVDHHRWDPVIGRYLDRLGQANYEAKARQQWVAGCGPMETH